MKEGGRGNTLSEIGKVRGWGGSTRRENKMISLLCLVQSLKVTNSKIVKTKLQSSSKQGPRQRITFLLTPACSYTLSCLAHAFIPNCAVSLLKQSATQRDEWHANCNPERWVTCLRPHSCSSVPEFRLFFHYRLMDSGISVDFRCRAKMILSPWKLKVGTKRFR